MCAHSSGVIGFPLRLLAREVYDRVVAMKGEKQVALMTGEERIVPPSARYFLCTAESHAGPDRANDRPAEGPFRDSSPSPRSTRRSSASIPSAAMSSPTGCSARAAARRR